MLLYASFVMDTAHYLAKSSSCLLYVFSFKLRDEDTTEDDQRNNWFSAHSAHKVYGTSHVDEVWSALNPASSTGQYIQLDVDHNGMLNRRELLG